jgi:DNA-binding MurR/RpiR family transcriptional regulator
LLKKILAKKEQPSSGKYHDEVAKSVIEVLQSTSCLINEEKLTKVIQLINQASSLYNFGV